MNEKYYAAIGWMIVQLRADNSRTQIISSIAEFAKCSQGEALVFYTRAAESFGNFQRNKPAEDNS